MSFVRAGQLARATTSARPDDPLGLVAENLRASNYGAIPVLDRLVVAEDNHGDINGPKARVLGLADERDLAHHVLPGLAHREAVHRESILSEAGHSGAAAPGAPPLPEAVFRVAPGESYDEPDDFLGNGTSLNGHGLNGYHEAETSQPAHVTELEARDVMRRDFGIVPAMFSLHNALITLERYDSSALPVVDAMGSYRGMISRADIIAALGQQVRPPVVGGMATPLGVWLTTGSLNAGAPPVGLFLSGMVMAFCLCFAQLTMLLGLSFINQEWAAMFVSGRLGATSETGTILNLVTTVVQGLIFLLVLRALPMSGIHAAEHQTVWAIEKGLPLTPEYVSQMPRAHPRCGTNLVALGGLIQIIFQHLPEINSGTVLISLLFVYLTWRNFGTALQEYFTTKPATRKQLESGIKAGREIMEKYQAQPHVMTSFGTRLFNSGLIGAAIGMFIVLVLFDYVQYYVARLLLT